MECTEQRDDMRAFSPEEGALMQRQAKLAFHFNTLAPGDPEAAETAAELFGSMGAGAVVSAPIQGARFDRVSLGAGVFVNSNCLFMANGGITIEDGVQIASNVQLITNNHDVYDRAVLTSKPIIIHEGAWIGAGATILRGVEIGRYAVVGAGAVVTHDVADYEMVVGVPARRLRMLDASQFA